MAITHTSLSTLIFQEVAFFSPSRGIWRRSTYRRAGPGKPMASQRSKHQSPRGSNPPCTPRKTTNSETHSQIHLPQTVCDSDQSATGFVCFQITKPMAVGSWALSTRPGCGGRDHLERPSSRVFCPDGLPGSTRAVFLLETSSFPSLKLAKQAPPLRPHLCKQYHPDLFPH